MAPVHRRRSPSLKKAKKKTPLRTLKPLGRRQTMKSRTIEPHMMLKKLLTPDEYEQFRGHDESIQKNSKAYYDKTSPMKTGMLSVSATTVKQFAGLELKVGGTPVQFYVTRTGGEYYYGYYGRGRNLFMLVHGARTFAHAVAMVVSDPAQINAGLRRQDCGQMQWVSRKTANASGRANVDGGWMFSGKL